MLQVFLSYVLIFQIPFCARNSLLGLGMLIRKQLTETVLRCFLGLRIYYLSKVTYNYATYSIQPLTHRK